MTESHETIDKLIHDHCAALGEYVCPIYVVDRENGFLIGSGVPITVGSVRFIATATHVLEQAERLGQHVLTAGYERPFRLTGEWRGYKHKRGTTVDVDLSVILVNDVEWDELMRRFSATSVTDFGDVPSEVDYLAVIGYPHSKNKPTPRSKYHLEPRVTYVASNMLRGTESSRQTGKDNGLHFAVSADARAVTGKVALPKPWGMSGGGVWNLRLRQTLTGHGTPQLVGIGIEFDTRRRVFVCTRIAPVLTMIDDLIS